MSRQSIKKISSIDRFQDPKVLPEIKEDLTEVLARLEGFDDKDMQDVR